MPVEIERKFLVAGNTWRSDVISCEHLHQVYLTANEALSVRVRISGAELATMTTKLPGSGITRYEFEQRIPIDEAASLMRMSDGNCIEKTRHSVDHAGHRWVIDCYEGDNAGLVVAEIELEQEDEHFVPPPWLGEEITGVSRYRNSTLARQPYESWKDQLSLKASA